MIKETIRITKEWIETFVIQLNLCPFAAHPFKNNKIRYVVFEGNTDDLEKFHALCDEEIKFLENALVSDVETTLIITPNAFHDFDDYLDEVDFLELGLEELFIDAEEVPLQLASFHPDYMFEDTEYSDVENFTNRSPFPMFHFLRTSRVTIAIEAHPDIDSVPENNIKKMRELGFHTVKQMYDDITGTH